MQNRFTNPANGAIYDWNQNHDPEGEEQAGKARTVTRVPNTSGGGVVLQQGDDGGYVIKLSGKILVRSQYRAFWQWFALSRTQSIYFRDFDGQEFEVQITSFTPRRKGKLGPSGRDPSMPHHYYEYSMEMTVLAFRAGDMYDMGVTP